MNAYLMQDDGEHYVICADSMHEACAFAEALFIGENYPDDECDNTPETMADARAEFRSLLQSCSLIGEVRA